jgi:hypothetical protein
MEENNHKHVVVLAFGLPVLTTAIVLGSMYAGHYLTVRSDTPTQVNVSAAPPNIDVKVESATPKIEVNVPQAAPPTIAVNATAPHVDVHVPTGPAPTVTFQPPSMPAPNITVNSPPAQVTVIREELRIAPTNHTATPSTPETATPAASPSLPTLVPPTPKTPSTSATPTPIILPSLSVSSAEITGTGTATPTNGGDFKALPETPINVSVNTSVSTNSLIASNVIVSPIQSTPTIPAIDLENPTIETLYTSAEKYIESYCVLHKLNPQVEAKKWNKDWCLKVEQAMIDDIDSSEQSFINRQVITKRDYFRLEKTTPEKVVEACRILLRYREAQLTWLQALQDAMTQENLRKSVTFLAAGTR